MSFGSGAAIKDVMLAGLLVFTALLPEIASATLGEPEASAQDDSRQLQGSIKSIDRSIYRVHEIQLPSGTLLREFVSPNGAVFAVAWNGPSIPNLRQLMGRYFEPYVAAAKLKQGRGDHNHLRIEQSDLVVYAAGHMRAVTGLAYLPQALPAGVTAGDLH